MITTRIIADSINEAQERITTFECTYPRFIHSEIMTHRALSKNSASSRAIPVEKMIVAAYENPAMFEQYGAKNTGMAAQELMPEEDAEAFRQHWLTARLEVLERASICSHKAAKQLVNRMLEPWSHMTIVVTATEWKNFFALRAHPAAQPEFQVLAFRMLDLYLKNTPVIRTYHPHEDPYGWAHLPYVTGGERRLLTFNECLAVSVARCARVSYTKHGQQKDLEDDIALHDRLISSRPMHASPLEHQAVAAPGETSGNFRGWKQYRQTIPGQNAADVNLEKILAAKPDWITL